MHASVGIISLCRCPQVGQVSSLSRRVSVTIAQHLGGNIPALEKRFYLQDYYVKEWAENFVIFIAVEDAQAWHDHASAALKERSYLDARVWPPKAEEWGALTTYAIDPSGVLIHFAQWIRR